jgi:hypothetical protein
MVWIIVMCCIAFGVILVGLIFYSKERIETNKTYERNKVFLLMTRIYLFDKSNKSLM